MRSFAVLRRPQVLAQVDIVPPMSNAATWASSAGNAFRKVARDTGDPTTKALAEGLAHLAEAIRELDQEELATNGL